LLLGLVSSKIGADRALFSWRRRGSASLKIQGGALLKIHGGASSLA
jgi:hypothetical protein